MPGQGVKLSIFPRTAKIRAMPGKKKAAREAQRHRQQDGGAQASIQGRIRPAGSPVTQGSGASRLSQAGSLGIAPLALAWAAPLPVAPARWLAAGGGIALGALMLAAWLERAGRRRAERRLEAAMQELRSAGFQAQMLLEATEDGIYALDPEGHCIWANPATARILGYPSAAVLVGRQMHDVIHHTRADGSPFPIEECTGLQMLKERQRVMQAEELLWRADGTSFYADVRVNPMVREGEMVGAVVVFRDLTERMRLESQYRQAQKMEAVGRLAAGIAHDFNNLLSVITGYTELLLQRPALAANDEQRLRAIERASGRAAELTRQLLAFSRKQAVQATVLDLNDVVRGAEPMLLRVLGEDLVFEVELEPNLAPIKADEGQLEQVLMNLAVNARDAMPEGGRLRIQTAGAVLDAAAAEALNVAPGSYATLAVADTGVGMDAETIRHIFEPFFTIKPVGKGSGLGLSMVFGIVRQSGGAIKVESEPGRGTAMKVFLPVYNTAGEETTAPAAPDAAGAAADQPSASRA